MRIRYYVFAFSLLFGPPTFAHGQEAEPALAQGDSVRFSFPTDPGPTTWTGIVREVVNPRECVFVLVRSYEGSNTFGIAFTLSDRSMLERLAPEPSTFSGAQMNEQGIKCIEAHRQALPMYLNPPSEADEEAGA